MLVYLPVWQSLIVFFLLWLLYGRGLFGFGFVALLRHGLLRVRVMVIFVLSFGHCEGRFVLRGRVVFLSWSCQGFGPRIPNRIRGVEIDNLYRITTNHQHFVSIVFDVFNIPIRRPL